MSFGEAGIAPQQSGKEDANVNRQQSSAAEYFPLSIEGFGPGSIHEAACQRRVLILRGIPESVPQEEITKFFTKPDAPVLKNISYAGNSRWYLVFDNESDAREANFMLNRDIQVICDRPIKACFKHSMPLFQQKQVFEQHIRHQMFMSAPSSHVSSPVPPSTALAAAAAAPTDVPTKQLEEQIVAAPPQQQVYQPPPQFPAQFNVIPTAAFPGQFVSTAMPAALHINPFAQGGAVFAAPPQNPASIAPIAVHLALSGAAAGGQMVKPPLVAERKRTLSVQTAAAAQQQRAPSPTDESVVAEEYDGDESAELLMESKVFTSSRLNEVPSAVFIDDAPPQVQPPPPVQPFSQEPPRHMAPSRQQPMARQQSQPMARHQAPPPRHQMPPKQQSFPQPRQQPRPVSARQQQQPAVLSAANRVYNSEQPAAQQRRSNTLPRSMRSNAATRRNVVEQDAAGFSYAAALKTGLQPSGLQPGSSLSARR